MSVPIEALREVIPGLKNFQLDVRVRPNGDVILLIRVGEHSPVASIILPPEGVRQLRAVLNSGDGAQPWDRMH